jgi:hypothetical protein
MGCLRRNEDHTLDGHLCLSVRHEFFVPRRTNEFLNLSQHIPDVFETLAIIPEKAKPHSLYARA